LLIHLILPIASPGDPVQVQWESVAYFTDDSIIIPTPEFLNTVLEQSLDDPQDYIDELSTLNSANPFSTTVDAFFTIPKTPPNSSTNDTPIRTSDSGSTASGIPGIVGAAAALTVVLVGFVAYRHYQSRQEGSDDNNVKLNKKHRGDGTVAGETFTGETHDGSTSVYDGRMVKDVQSKGGKKKSGKLSSRQAIEDFDAFIETTDSHDNDFSSIPDPSSDSSSLGSLPPDEPLDSTLKRVRDEAEMEKILNGANGMIGIPARRPKSVDEIENLLAKDIGEIR
jgi:hypothetical protein